MKGRTFLLFALLLSRVGAQIVPVEDNLPGYEVVQVLSDLFRVTDFAVTPDNRLITVAKEGAVEVYDATTYKKLSTIDLSDSICTAQENGIQSITLHPDFANNGYLYMFYVRASPGGDCVYPPEGTGYPVEGGPTSRLSRFTLPTGTNTIDLDSEFVLLDFGPCAKKHNGGGVQFGPDGLLYIGTGDVGHKRALNMPGLTNTLHGKILRLTETGGIPPDNPYVDNPNSVPCGINQELFPSEDRICQEIFSFGVRNPFNLAMDPSSSAESIRFFINDVGQESYEEISESGTGYELLNYGWPEREGPCFDQGEKCDIDEAFVDPLHWWPNGERSIAATAGAVVPPGAPGAWANFDGDYLYGGYGDSRIFHMKPGNPNACRGPQCSTQISEYTAVPIVEGVNEDDERLLRIHFADYQGSATLYFLTHSKTGGLYVLSPLIGTNRRPFANITQFLESDGSQLTVNVNASDSSDPDGDGLSYQWDFGDSNATSTGVVAHHTYTSPGKYIVTLTVTDAQGATATESVSVTLPQVSVFSTPPMLFPWRTDSLEGEELRGVLEFCSDGESIYGYRLPCDDKCLPGLAPIIRVQPGKLYQFTLRNVAPAETRTNIHTHGLHLPGSGDADDVTRVVTGGNCLDYTWDISPDHPGGTYWYHPHYHGLSEEQVAGGAYGLLIVEDNTSTNNDIPEWASNELLLMISLVDGVFGGNGKPYNIFNIDANQWYRLRVSVVDVLGVPLELRFTNGCEVHQVASDGIWHSRVPGPVSNQYELTGASRADFAVRCGAVVSTLRSAVVASTVNILYNDQPVAVVNVGPVEPNPFLMEEWTPARPASLQNVSSASVPDENRLSLEIQRQTINDLEWDANIPLATIAYNQVHEWELSDSSKHPFHLHLYHMLVMTPGGCGAHKEGEFYDTIAGPPCTVRFKAADFGQRCVFHCHVMEHGDLGAMGWVDVQGEGMPINDIVSPERNCSSPNPEICSSSTPSPSYAPTSSPAPTTGSPAVALPSPTDPQPVSSPPMSSPVSSDQEGQQSGSHTVISDSTERSVSVALTLLAGLFWTMMMM